MSHAHREILRINHNFIIRNLEFEDRTFQGCLIQNSVLNSDKIQAIALVGDFDQFCSIMHAIIQNALR